MVETVPVRRYLSEGLATFLRTRVAGTGSGERCCVQPTVREELVLKKLSIENTRAIADIVYRSEFDKAHIAELSKLADVGYESSDPIATGLLQQAADDMALAINTIIRRLDMREEVFDVVAIGGTFNSPFPFVEKISKRLIAEKSSFVVCEKNATDGAIKMARHSINN
jgi:N-acetylglucosamine kinase-like BadF-type ATPase